jgi:hypothetical protein
LVSLELQDVYIGELAGDELGYKVHFSGFQRNETFSSSEDGVDRKVMIMSIEEDLLFRLFGESKVSISIFILGTNSSKFSCLTSHWLVKASIEVVCLILFLGVGSSIETLVLTCVIFGWYFLLVNVVVDLRYPFGFNKFLGSNIGVVYLLSGLLLVFFGLNAILFVVELPSEK